MHEIFSIEKPTAGLRVRRDAERVELEVVVGSAAFAVTLPNEEAERLALALLRGVPPQAEPRRLRAVPRRVNTEGA